MRGKSTIAVIVLTAALIAAAAAAADEAVPTREEYVAKVDPICKANTDLNRPLLKSSKELSNEKKYKPAAIKVEKAVKNFGKTLRSIEAVPRPPEDSPRLERWFGYLKIAKTNLGKVAKALREENRVKAVHEEIRTERSINAAHNVSFTFKFKYCDLRVH
jgi:hypothetical protein